MLGVVFADQFLQGVGRFGPRSHTLDFRQHFGIAVGGTGGGVDHASRLAFPGGAQHVEGAVDVDIVRRHGVVDGARYRGDRGFVEDYGGAADQRGDLLVVADVGALEIDARANLLDVALPAGEQIIDDDDAACPFGKQAAYDGGADEARPSGYDVVAHD